MAFCIGGAGLAQSGSVDDRAGGGVRRTAVWGAEQHPSSIVLLGAEAHYAEIEYGWIEPGPLVAHGPAPLLRVKRFWEKPSLPEARALLLLGSLWNTFVTVGHASAFLDLLRARVPTSAPSRR